MIKAGALALAGLVLCSVSPAAAQDQLVTTFVPESQRRWDAAGFVGWSGVNKSDIAQDWNDWYDVAAFSVSTGRYLTPHIKVDVDLSATTPGRVFSEELFGPPGPLPYYGLRRHRFHRTSLATILAYQFFENRWVHPYLGVGLAGVREEEREEVELVPVRGLGLLPIAETHVAYVARPFISGGVKFYLSERAFMRTDLRSAFSAGGTESVVWRLGVGVDF